MCHVVCAQIPRCRSTTWICMCGHTLDIVIYSMFYQDQFRGFGAPGSRNLPFPITVAIGLYNSLCYRTSRDYWNPRDMIEDIVRRTVQFVTLGVFMCMLHIPFVFASVCVQYLHHHISSCCFSPSRWTKYCGQRILCMSVCLSVC